jgi:hypothetical protein
MGLVEPPLGGANQPKRGSGLATCSSRHLWQAGGFTIPKSLFLGFFLKKKKNYLRVEL